MKYWLETLGCPKNQVDSDKIGGLLESEGYHPASAAEAADLVVVNTCAFIEAAREESVETILEMASRRRPGARLAVTGCLAERYGAELAEALPEVDVVAGFGVPVTLGARSEATRAPAAPVAVAPGPAVPVAVAPGPNGARLGADKVAPGPNGARLGADKVAPGPDAARFDLLNLPRPPAGAPWAYVKVAEGCDRHCGFCAIPSFRGRQRSRPSASVVAEVDQLGVQEVVLVAQDLASYGRDLGAKALVELVEQVAQRVERVRLLYLYPSELTEGLIDVIGRTGCPYFDLSLQHVSRPHLRRMRRWGDGERFEARIADIRRRWPQAAFRSSFIVGYPGETEHDHDQLLAFLDRAELDWAGFFAFSPETGTFAATLAEQVPPGLAAERLAEASEVQDAITARRRRALVGTEVRVLVDEPGVARSHREAPEIDGVIRVDPALEPGRWVQVLVTAAVGPDLEAAVLPGAA